MSKYIENVVLSDLLKISPIPMEMANRMTSVGWMLEIEKIINEILEKADEKYLSLHDDSINQIKEYIEKAKEIQQTMANSCINYVNEQMDDLTAEFRQLVTEESLNPTLLEKISLHIDSIIGERYFEEITESLELRQGYYAEGAGFTSNTSCLCTDYIECDTNDLFRVTGVGMSNVAVISTFAENGDFIRQYGKEENTKPFIADKYEFRPQPDEKKVIFSSIDKTWGTSPTLLIEVERSINADDSFNNLKHSFDLLKANVSTVTGVQDFLSEPVDVTDKYTYTQGFINKTSGDYVSNTCGLTSEFIVNDGNPWYITASAISATCCIATYDDSKRFIKAYGFNTDDSAYSMKDFMFLPTPQEKYFRITSFDTNYGTNPVLKIVRMTVRPLENYLKSLEKKTYSTLAGKKIVFEGDSIMYGAGWRPTPDDYKASSWGKLIENRIPDVQVYNYAIGGSTIAVKSGNPSNMNIVNRIQTAYNKNPDADIVVLEGGVNDVWQNVPIGVMTSGYNDSYDTSTFAGALEYILKYAKEKWIGKKVVFLGTHNIPDANLQGNKGLKAFMEMAKQICNKWSCPYLDLFNEDGLCMYIDTIKNGYTSNNDGCHYNQAGYEYTYPLVLDFLEKQV